MNRVGDSLFCTGSNERILHSFVANGVEFLVVGGLAVSWYCATRQADDMDLLVNPTITNSERIYIALNGLNLPAIEKLAFAKCSVQLPLKNEYYADIITPATNGITFEEVMCNTAKGKLFNIPVLIPSVANLIRLKELAIQLAEDDTEKHRKDIELLRAVHIEQIATITN